MPLFLVASGPKPNLKASVEETITIRGVSNRKSILFLLLTPLIVIVSSTLAFRFGFGPEATKNNGIFFNEFTDITGMEISSIKNFKLDFEDGKWVMGIYHNNEGKTLEFSLRYYDKFP